MKLNLGCGPLPLHAQHYHREFMAGPEGWTLVDLYVKDPQIKNWDATNLVEVADSSVEHIYCSHLLEHIPYVDVEKTVKHWYTKLTSGGILTLNVPDLAWAAEKVLDYDNGQPLDGYFHDWDGEHGLLAVIFGAQSHEGEFHHSGFTERSMNELLTKVGFSKIETHRLFEAHQMGCIIAKAVK